MCFHLSLVAWEYHRVRPKWFLHLWYVWHKLCTYLAPIITPKSPRSYIRCVQNISVSMVCLGQTVHRACFKISTIPKQTETSFHLSYITYEYHQVRQKWFLSLEYVWRKMCTYVAPKLTPSPNEPKQDLTWPMSPRDPSGVSKMISEPMVHLAQPTHLSYTQFQTDWNKIPQDPRYLAVPLGASKPISEPMVHLAQTMHLSCTDNNTISKWTKTRFDITHVT
jgi:hypothetical protein